MLCNCWYVFTSVTRSPTHAANADVNNINTAIATWQPDPSHGAPARKTKHRRSFREDGGSNEFTSSGEHISRLANSFQFLADESEVKKKVFAALHKVEGLSQGERIIASGLIVSDTSTVSYFFPLPDECKSEYVDWAFEGYH